MSDPSLFSNTSLFPSALFEKMIRVNPGIADLELYEFCYALEYLTPVTGWQSVDPPAMDTIEALIQPLSFFDSIQIKPIHAKHIVLDQQIADLTRVLFAGLVSGTYPVEWVNRLFYFDIRGFFFLVRTSYFTPEALQRYGGKPQYQFEPAQSRFDRSFEISYREILEANRLIDQAFLDCMLKIFSSRGSSLLLALVGPTAAGKTEIVSRMCHYLEEQGRSITHIEMDHFLKDREFRDGKGMNRETIHFDLFKQSMEELLQGHRTSIPRYDFLHSVSSHDTESRLRPGQSMIQVEPADLLLLEGNFPFHLSEISPLIGLKIVYLTDDPIRLKRKWQRDIDLRKKYDPVYFCNRFFKTQRQRADEIYRPMIKAADMVVDTTGAALWTTPEIAQELQTGES